MGYGGKVVGCKNGNILYLHLAAALKGLVAGGAAGNEVLRLLGQVADGDVRNGCLCLRGERCVR